MKVAIVGTSVDLTENEERDVRQFVAMILKDYSTESIVISGGAKSVDMIAVEIASQLGFRTETYKPKEENWKSYRERNLQVARDCDVLFCISVPVHTRLCYHHIEPQYHQKTAGCWTLNEAYKMGKHVRLLVTPYRL